MLFTLPSNRVLIFSINFLTITVVIHHISNCTFVVEIDPHDR